MNLGSSQTSNIFYINWHFLYKSKPTSFLPFSALFVFCLFWIQCHLHWLYNTCIIINYTGARWPVVLFSYYKNTPYKNHLQKFYGLNNMLTKRFWGKKKSFMKKMWNSQKINKTKNCNRDIGFESLSSIVHDSDNAR